MHLRDPWIPIVGLLTLAVASARAGTEVPGAPQQAPIALVGGTIHPVNGADIPNGTLVFDRGRITAVGRKPKLPNNAVKIDVSGQHIYPGLFDAFTNLGLAEIGSVDETKDEQEFGPINPNARAVVAFHTDSEIIPVTRAAGVLLSLIAPSGGLLAGRSSVMQLDGWTWEDMELRGDVGLHIEWPWPYPEPEWLAEKPVAEQLKERDTQLRQLRRAFEQAAEYRLSRRAPGSRQPLDARWEAMLPVLDGQMPVIVYADDLREIQSAVGFCDHWRLKLIVHGGYDAPRCATLLRKHNVPVIVDGVHRLPQRRSTAYDEAYTLPARLHEAGLKFCISAPTSLGATHVRNLAYNAGTAVGFGLPPDEALKAITLYPAEILGVADRVGSLVPGKDATLIVTTGNPLETDTLILAAFVQGRQVDLTDRHQRLYKKYEEKQRRLSEPRNAPSSN